MEQAKPSALLSWRHLPSLATMFTMRLVRTPPSLRWPPSCTASSLEARRPGLACCHPPGLRAAGPVRQKHLFDAPSTDQTRTIWNAGLVLATAGLHLAQFSTPLSALAQAVDSGELLPCDEAKEAALGDVMAPGPPCTGSWISASFLAAEVAATHWPPFCLTIYLADAGSSLEMCTPGRCTAHAASRCLLESVSHITRSHLG